MKKIVLLILIISLMLIFSGCMMKLLNLSIPEGIYVGYDGNNWLQTDNKNIVENSKFIYDENLKLYKVTIDASKINFNEVDNDGNKFYIGYYKVFYVKNDGNIVSDSIPVLKSGLLDNQINIYLDVDKLSNGKGVGVGDDTKLNMNWYVAGSFNNWTPEQMNKVSNHFEIEINKEYKKGENIEYKIPASTTWKPWQMIFNGEVYSDSSQNQIYTFKNDVTGFIIKFFPLISYVEIEELKVGDSQ
ncbi:hypothetical protein [Marinitoga sp. 38H-ov]|uniref:hypothetical protein n=1 Tax=Marinitoga sp. 38H-ov TaxID=1755814 RepID=UPI0013EA00C9|nr:hypothetical protein [Marinitoga sp. 38H-ov]KAF2956585.1 hypothetical protein AS160_05150 [Marinitoga sp. 38H-ov]